MSAKQGKELNTKIEKINNKIISGENGFSKEISNININIVTDTGFYYGNNLINGPSAYGYLLVLSHPLSKDYTLQIFSSLGVTDSLYIRQQEDGQWKEWKRATFS